MCAQGQKTYIFVGVPGLTVAGSSAVFSEPIQSPATASLLLGTYVYIRNVPSCRKYSAKMKLVRKKNPPSGREPLVRIGTVEPNGPV